MWPGPAMPERLFPLLLLLAAAGCEPQPDGAAAVPAVPPAYDWLLRGGTLVDGTGASSRIGDLLLDGGRIAHIGTVDPDTLEIGRIIEAEGLLVAPGFIDLHAHGDPVSTPGFENFLAMGVTTIVLGQDGTGPEVATLPATFQAADDARPGVNVAYLVGHNTLRAEAGVGFAASSSSGSTRMAALVAEAMEAGAFGLSLGLEYDPGRHAGLDELVAIAEPVARSGGVVMSHMRNEDVDAIEASVRELLEQGARSGARVHASHLKIVLGRDPAQARAILSLLEEARREGVEVTADVYPYLASFTGLSILFPDWARPPHDYQSVAAQRREELAAYLRRRVEDRGGPAGTLFGTGPWSGRTLEEAATETGRAFEEILVELGPAGARAAYFVMDEAVMATFLLDPHVAVASDGGPTMAHPRGYGTFPRVLRRYALDEERLTLEEGIRKMTGLPASILGLDRPERVELPRGRLEAGWAADVIVLDPEAIGDRADYLAPHRLANGVARSWVNGELAWTHEGPTEGRGHGRALRARR